MGAELWHNFTPYQADVQKALNELRQRVFQAGDFYLSELKPKSIDEAFRNADATGTRSVLDLERISKKREINAISAVPMEELRKQFGTDKPTRKMIERALSGADDSFNAWLESYERCEGFYLVVHENNLPVELFFAGWSAD